MIAAGRTLLDALYARPVPLLVITAFFWASHAIAAQFARGEISPMQHVLMRWIFVTALVWPFYGGKVLDHLAAARRHWWQIALMALLGFTGFNLLFYFASFNTTAVNVGILQGSVPVLVLIFAYLGLGTRVGPVQAIGVLATLVGVVMVATRGTPWLVLEIAFNAGDIFMLLACASYAAYAVFLQRRPAMPGAVFFTMMAPVALLTALPPALYEATMPGYTWPTLQGWLITLFVAIFPGTLAQQFFLRGVDLIGPSRAGVFTNLVPIFASAMAVVILGEHFAWYHGVALVLVLGGIALAQHTANR